VSFLNFYIQLEYSDSKNDGIVRYLKWDHSQDEFEYRGEGNKKGEREILCYNLIIKLP
jgi:hypothetical protein